jgi:CHAD domain-containing protein
MTSTVAYRFQRNEPIAEEIKRLAREQLQGAIDSLSRLTKRDEGIHDARKRVKKTRALVRLVRAELGDLYAEENTRLRDAGRGLSEFRDAAVVIETFDGVRGKFHDELAKHPLDGIRRGLRLRKSRGERRANVRQAVQDISATLSACERQVAKWTLNSSGFAAIGPGLEQTFRRGRKAMATAHKHPAPENFHEWRKRVKDHWYHVRLLEDLWADVMGGYEKSLKQLEDWLGMDHNLAVLREKVTAEPEFYGPTQEIEGLVKLIGKYEEELRANTLEMGSRIYLDDPREFTKRIERLWNAWQG